MNMSLPRLVENILPPLVVKKLRDLFVRTSFRGDYPSYSDALQACGGEELLKDEGYVARAFNPRPSFEATHFCNERQMQVLAAFALPLSRRTEANRFRVLDFGGGPGAYYFFARPQMPDGLSLEWDVFDTALMASQGRKTYASPPPHFFSEWPEVLRKRYDVILASNTIHIFEDPYQVIDRLASIDCKYFIAQDVPTIEGTRDRLTIQMPPALTFMKIYRKKSFPLFPTWFFSEEKLLKRFARDYAVKMWWYSGNTALLDGRPVARKGYLLEKK
jgi:putative methyltransferase (TIGR04325 family)